MDMLTPKQQQGLMEVMRIFSPRQQQDFLSLHAFLKEKGISPDDLAAAVVQLRRARHKEAMLQNLFESDTSGAAVCPHCNIPMVLRPAGEEAADGAHWTCPKCRFGQYDTRSAEEIIKSLRAGGG